MFLHHPRDDDDDDTGGDAQSHVDDGDDDDDSVQETLQWGFDINQSLANKKEDKPSLSHYKMTIMTMMKMWQGRVRVDFKFSKGEKWNEKKVFTFLHGCSWKWRRNFSATKIWRPQPSHEIWYSL